MLEKNLLTGGRLRTIGDRHHARPEHLGDAVAVKCVANFQLFCHDRPSAFIRKMPRLAYSATVSAERDTLAANCLSVVRKFTGSEVNFCSACCGFKPSNSTTSHSDLSI